MNPIEKLAYIIGIILSCSADMPATEQVIGGNVFQTQTWHCDVQKIPLFNGPLTVKAWRRPCRTENTDYWGRMVFLNFEELNIQYYINRFGETQSGEGVSLSEAYLPSCGS